MKFIWAFDPGQSPKEAKRIVQEIKTWTQKFNASVQPICILSDSLLTAYNTKEAQAYLQHQAESAVNVYIKKAAGKHFLPAKIIFTESNSKRRKALILADYADNNKTDLIFLDTHTKNVWKPVALGGFSEALITITKTPLLVINPFVRKTGEPVTEILFATDFERASKKALATLVPFAQKMKAHITLYNQVATTLLYASNMGSPFVIHDTENIIKEITRTRSAKCRKWVERLSNSQVESTARIKRQKFSLARDIVEVAKHEEVDLIALVNERQPTAERILGSTPRNVLLRAHCPVLILR